MHKCHFNKVELQFIENALWHGCSPVNLLLIFRTLFPKNTSGQLLLKYQKIKLYLKKALNLKPSDLVQLLGLL